MVPKIDNARRNAGQRRRLAPPLNSVPRFAPGFRKSPNRRENFGNSPGLRLVENLKLGGDFLGLGVGHEPLIFHLAHMAKSVVATDLFDIGTAWAEARLAVEAVYEASPFPYPREASEGAKRGHALARIPERILRRCLVLLVGQAR